MEDYKKKYEDSLERARIWKEKSGMPIDKQGILDDIFPELKKSEGEESKKWILEYLHDGLRKSDEQFKGQFKAAIAWLEKQGEEKSQSDSKKLSEQIKDFEGEFGCWNSAQDFRPKHLQRCLCYDKYMKGVYCYVYDDISKYWCTQTTEEHNPDGDNHICDYADYRVTVWMSLPDTSFYPSKTLLDKQGEQNLVDKVEQKFKVGDWVVFNGFVLHIDEIVDGYYRTTTIGGIPNSYDWNIDNAARLWTIQDARDGDVLAEDSCIFIIRKLGDESTIAKTYCALFNDGDFYDSTMLCFDVDSTKPATEEQRELLFKKMAENGYAWDSEKKELKLVITNGGDFEPELSHKEVSHKEVTKKSEHDGKKWIDEKVYWKEREELFEDGKQEVINNPMKYGLIKLLTPTKSACVE